MSYVVLFVYLCAGGNCDKVPIAIFDTTELCEIASMPAAAQFMADHPGYSFDGHVECVPREKIRQPA